MIKRSAIAAFLALAPFAAGAAMASEKEAEAEPAGEPICRLIETAAQAQGLPIAFLTRLIWQESSFQPGVTSPAGAQGVAQFMPGTAAARGLANPYDPEQAIPKAAELLAALKAQFGNLGLAAAAYNAGPGRLANWLAGAGTLPEETRAYVAIVTGRVVEQWTGDAEAAKAGDGAIPPASCAGSIAMIRTSAPVPAALSVVTALWGVQIAGSFSKAAALAAYQRARAIYAGALGDHEPMILGGRLRSRGFNAFYRVRAPVATRAEGEALCDRILRAGGACVVLRN